LSYVGAVSMRVGRSGSFQRPQDPAA